MKTLILLFTQLSILLYIVSCCLIVEHDPSQENSVEVVFTADHGTITPSGAIQLQIDSVITPVITPSVGYNFKAWDVSENIEIIGSANNPASSLRIKGNGTIAALFKPAVYSISINSENTHLGTVAPEGTTQKSYGDEITLTATPLAHTRFIKWTSTNDILLAAIDDTLTMITTLTIRASGVVTALFAPDRYPITVIQPKTGGAIAFTPETDSVDFNKELTFTVSPVNGWHFNHWTGGSIDGTRDNPITTSIGPADSFSAVLELNICTLTVASTVQHGTVTSALGEYVASVGEVITITATPDTGYQFTGWTGDASGTANPLAVTINGNMSVTPTFTPIPGNGAVYVWKGVPAGGLKDGTSWLNAYTDLNTALTNAAINAEIWIAQGVYAPATSATFTPQEGTRIYGGFNGFEKLLSDRKFSEHFTELNGSGSSIIMQFGYIGISISGCVFKNALNNAIKIAKGNCTVEDCIFRQNNETAILINGGLTIVRNTQIKRCGFHSNSGPASTAGKAISVGSSARTTLIQNSCFINNSGPAISDNNTSRTVATNDYTSITNCTIANNVSTDYEPGGIRSTGNTRLRGCILYYNNNSTAIGTQMDSTYIVDDCDIQYHATSRGVTKKDSMYWEPSNIDISPNFNFDFDSGTLPSDGQWFSTATDLPFIPRESTLYNADFTLEKSTDDFRRTARTATFDIGAYEKH